MQSLAHRPNRRMVVFVMALGLLCSAVAACTSSGSSPSASSSSATSVNACVQRASARVTAAQRPMKVAVPSVPADASKARGKNVWNIAFSSAIPLSNAATAGFDQAAAAVGVKVTNFDGQGEPAIWSQGIEEAVAHHASAIYLDGSVSSLAPTALHEALAARIPIITSTAGNPGDPLNGLYTDVSTQYTNFGRIMADVALAKTRCNAKIALFTSTELSALVEMDNGVESEVRSLCPTTCKVTIENADPGTIATTAGPLAQDVVRRDPQINFIISAYDALALYLIPGLKQANSTIPIVSQSGSPANMQFVKDGTQYADLAFPDNQYIGWLAFDEVIRALAGQPAATEQVPAQLVIHGQSFNPNDPFPDFGDFASLFEKSWGVGG
jgi:ribose transport system substrate-binding protein